MKRKTNKLMRNNYFILLLVVSVTFFSLGKLGFILSEGSGFAALIWPPAGASLIFMLVFGYRVWPGIFLGALLVSASTLPVILENPLLLFTFPQLFTISAGATMQAFVATWLVRKFKVADHDFSDPKKIGLFYFLVGPVACLTNATTAFLSFFIMGVSSFNSLIEEWLLWWAADSASTIIFFTLFMAIFIFEKKRRAIVSTVLGMGLFVTFGMFFVGRLWEQERMTLLFTQEVISAAEIIEQIETRQIALINNLMSFKNFRPNLNKQDFETFARNNLETNKSVRSIAWIKLVEEDERITFDKDLKALHGSDAMIWQLGDNKQKDEVAQNDNYLPVLLIEPYDRYKNAIGYDVSIEKDRREATEAALAINGPFLTSPVELNLEPGGPKAVTIYNPVYTDGELEGFFAILIKVESLIDVMIANADVDDLEVSMRDKNFDGIPIFNSTRIMDGYIDRSPITVEVNIFNRTWELLFRRTMNFINKNRTSQPLFIGIAGMVFSALISIGIIILSGQRLFLEKLVRSRTIDLQKANLTKSEFMANMSHDLRTPLNAIIGFSDMMQKELYGSLGSDKYLE